MKISIDPVIASRIKTAWQNLSAEQQRRFTPLLLKAHQRAITASQAKVAPPPDASGEHALELAISALTDDRDGIVSNLDAGVTVEVDKNGNIWGTGKYEQLDPGWTQAGAEWLEHLLQKKADFSTTPASLQIPDKVEIALAGDWGTGDWRTSANPAPSTDVRKHMEFLNPHCTIHLGDVYYAGTASEEQHLLVKIWPKGSDGSLALNSNHEMYSGGGAYFKAIGEPPFDKQRGCSYFALENDKWVIVGLDSAYYADEEHLYEDGALFAPNAKDENKAQLSFLQAQAAKMAQGKRLIILTHHQGIAQDGSSQTLLWSQVMSAFPPGTAPAYWYWGHVHAGIVYPPPRNGPPVLCRCCGHGGIPYGQSSAMAAAQAKGDVTWYENRFANDPDNAERVLNGFAVLSLNGDEIREVFYDENGGTAWSSGN